MFGTSPVNQETANTLIPQLLEVNGKKFLSIEPQLGEIDLAKVKELNPYIDSTKARISTDIGYGKIDWIICGGESGPNRRPFDANWARLLRSDCKTLGIPFFMKQIDKVIDIPDDLMVRQFPKDLFTI